MSFENEMYNYQKYFKDIKNVLMFPSCDPLNIYVQALAPHNTPHEP